MSCIRRLVADHQCGAVECCFIAHGEFGIADRCISSGLRRVVIYQAVKQDCGSGNVHTHRFAEAHDRIGGTGQVQNQRRIVDGGDTGGKQNGVGPAVRATSGERFEIGNGTAGAEGIAVRQAHGQAADGTVIICHAGEEADLVVDTVANDNGSGVGQPGQRDVIPVAAIYGVLPFTLRGRRAITDDGNAGEGVVVVYGIDVSKLGAEKRADSNASGFSDAAIVGHIRCRAGVLGNRVQGNVTRSGRCIVERRHGDADGAGGG